MAHTCHALYCEVPVQPRFFMCPPHWAMLPRLKQARIWQQYRPGQEQDKRPSPEYLRVAREAIHWLHEHEGKPGTLCLVCIEAEKENPVADIPEDEQRAKQDGIRRAGGKAKRIDPEWEQEVRRAVILAACRLQRFTIDEARELSCLRPSPTGEERAITVGVQWGEGMGLYRTVRNTEPTVRKGNHGSPRQYHISNVYMMDPTKFPTTDLPPSSKKPPKDY